jgi:hypothetical protein
MGGNERRVLITGCGRSGTKFTALLLQGLGLDVGHEQLGADGVSSWCMAVDSVDAPWGVGRRGLQFNPIFHQVRHPLKVISSLTTFTPPSWEFIARHVNCPADDPIVIRAAKYWYHWNRQTEHVAQWRYRIETLPGIFDEFCERLGVEPRRDVLRATSKMVNSRKTRRGFGLILRALGKFGIEQRSRALDFMYDSSASYLGKPFTWDVLEEHAPGWSARIRETSHRYGYTDEDDLAAVGLRSTLSSSHFKDIEGDAIQAI